MTTEEAFFADIRDNPGDDLPRLVYADWLDDNGDETDRKRAELIRLHCRLVALPPDDPGREAMRERASKLVEELKQAWFEPLERHADHWRIGRGFVESVVVRAPPFAAHGESIARLAPVAAITAVF